MPRIPNPKRKGIAVGSGARWRPGPLTATLLATPTAALIKLTTTETTIATTLESSSATMMAPRMVPGSALMRSQANVMASPGENVTFAPPTGGAP
jgi:hypothetical protein